MMASFAGTQSSVVQVSNPKMSNEQSAASTVYPGLPTTGTRVISGVEDVALDAQNGAKTTTNTANSGAAVADSSPPLPSPPEEKADSAASDASPRGGARDGDVTSRRRRRRRRRRHSFDGDVARRLARQTAQPGGVALVPHGADTQQRERANTCSSLPTDAEDSVAVAKFLREVRSVDDDAAVAAAPRGDPSLKADTGDAEDAVGAPATTEVVGVDESSKSLGVGAGTVSSGQLLPVPLQPLAGRCCFEGCGEISVFRCRRCRTAFYCGRDHQRSHWPQHRRDCEEGKGEPPPPLARLVLPPPPQQQQQQRQKAVGWADSAPFLTADGRGASPASGGGIPGGGGKTRTGSSAVFRETRSRLEAAMASNHGGGALPGGFDPGQMRTARGGASWTVPSSNGSAAVWPASSSSSSPSAAAASGGTGIWQKGGLSSQLPPVGSPLLPPPPPPPGPPPPAKQIPPPSSRPLSDTTFGAGGVQATSGYAAGDVEMLTEMGFDRDRAVQALCTCSGVVERAAEWLLLPGGGEDDSGVGGIGGGMPYGPHLPGGGSAAAGGQDGDGGGTGWLGGGTELSRIVGRTGQGGGGGDDNGDDDDLITSADASDVGDMRNFLSSEKAAGDGGGGGAAGGFGDGAWDVMGGGEGALFGKLGGGSGARGGDKVAAEEDDGDDDDDEDELVTSYEDTLGGLATDIVVLFRPAVAAATNGESEGPAVGGGGQQGPVLTVVVRPLPGTAPASVDSGSSRGDYDRYEAFHEIEHAVSFPWREAEDLARRHETALVFRAASSATTAAAAAAAGSSEWQQVSQSPPLSPSSPLGSHDNTDAQWSPSWGRKNKVGRLLVGMLERRVDGGYQIFEPEAPRDHRRNPPGVPVACTYARPRGRALPKWDRSTGRRSPPPLPPPPPRAGSKWGSTGGELVHEPWSCQACTFFNEVPAFRTACEMCNTPRPSTDAALGSAGENLQHHREWHSNDFLLGSGGPGDGVGDVARGGLTAAATSTAAAAAIPPSQQSLFGTGGRGEEVTGSRGGGGGGGGAVEAAHRMETSMLAGEYNPRGVGGVAAGITGGTDGDNDGDDDDDENAVVDGILGGVSPGGGASPAAYGTRGKGMSGGNGSGAPDVAMTMSNAGIDWEGGDEWGGFGNASFGDDSPVNPSPQRTALGFTGGSGTGGGGGGGGGAGGRGGRHGSGGMGDWSHERERSAP